MRPSRSAALAVLVVPGVLFASGCGGNDAVSKDSLQTKVKSLVDSVATTKVTSVSCPGDLDAKVGKTETCTATYVNGAKTAVAVKVTAVKDSKASINIKVTKILKQPSS